MVTVKNSIVAANSNSAAMPDVTGAFVSGGYNLIGNVGDATGFTQTGDQKGTGTALLDPRLAPLNYYDCGTQTHALFSGSTAVNAANPNNELPSDQRGISRPVGRRDGRAFRFFQTNRFD